MPFTKVNCHSSMDHEWFFIGWSTDRERFINGSSTVHQRLMIG